MKKYILSLSIFITSFALYACGEDSKDPVVIPPPEIEFDRSDIKYIKTADLIVGIPKALNETDSELLLLINHLNNLSGSIPKNGLSRFANDTIWFVASQKENRYIPLNEPHILAGSIIIGNKKNYASSVDSLQLWTWIAELTYDKYLSENETSLLNNRFNKVKDVEYKEVYHHNGTKLLKDKVKNPPACHSAPRYLGELLKSCYVQNNYYPFVYEELARFDSEGKNFIESIFGEQEIHPNPQGITLPPIDYTQWIEMAYGIPYTKEIPIDHWYSKYILAEAPGGAPGIPIVASRFVSDSAIIQCKYIIETMIKELPFYALQWMHANHFRVGIIGAEENVTDLPENRAMPVWWPDTDWDARGRGYGATPTLPLMTCGEENIVYLPDSPFASRYPLESIMVHEFAHNIDQGLRESDAYTPSGNPFETELFAAFENAQTSGLWKNTYSMENAAEYWAEGVQAWFNTCRMIVPAKESGKKSFSMKYRTQLEEYDPLLYQLIEKHFTKDHLTGYHFDFEPK